MPPQHPSPRPPCDSLVTCTMPSSPRSTSSPVSATLQFPSLSAPKCCTIYWFFVPDIHYLFSSNTYNFFRFLLYLKFHISNFLGSFLVLRRPARVAWTVSLQPPPPNSDPTPCEREQQLGPSQQEAWRPAFCEVSGSARFQEEKAALCSTLSIMKSKGSWCRGPEATPVALSWSWGAREGAGWGSCEPTCSAHHPGRRELFVHLCSSGRKAVGDSCRDGVPSYPGPWRELWVAQSWEKRWTPRVPG